MARSGKKFEPLDENLVLPSAVRKASERASQIHKEAYEISPPSNDTVKIEAPTPPAQPTKVTVEDFKPVDLTKPQDTPAPTAPQPTNENRFSLPGDPAPAPAPTPAPAPAPAPTPAPEAPPARDYEREIGSYKGRLQAANKHIEDQNRRIANLEAMVIQFTQPVTSPEMKAENLITEDERNTYGDDFLNVVGKKAKELLGSELAKLSSEVHNMRGSLSQLSASQAMSQQDRFEAFMDRAVPDWQKQNVDPNFSAWLDLPDPASGVIRRQLLGHAHQNGDFNRVAWFFKGFNAETAPPSPASVPTPTAPNPGKVPLETLAAPGRATSAAAPSTAGDDIITKSQINRFYNLVNRGHYSDNPKEKDRLEKLIYKAMAEGRVVEG